MAGKWSNPILLKNFAESPQEGGKYEIGTLSGGGTRSGQKVFAAAYSGDAPAIRAKLSDHYGGVAPTGNAEVDEQLKGGQRDSLSCRWKVEKPKKPRQPKAKPEAAAAPASSS